MYSIPVHVPTTHEEIGNQNQSQGQPNYTTYNIINFYQDFKHFPQLLKATICLGESRLNNLEWPA